MYASFVSRLLVAQQLYTQCCSSAVRCPFDVRPTFSVTTAAQRSASYWPCLMLERSLQLVAPGSRARRRSLAHL